MLLTRHVRAAVAFSALRRGSETATVVRMVAAAASPTTVALVTRGGSSAFAAAAAAPGLGAALASPAASALGFMIWADHWRGGSAFSLNLVKNVVASTFFLVTLLATNCLPPNPLTPGSPLQPLAFSALLGVVIGDCTAIGALKRLGSRRYLLIDCLKPALAAMTGVFFLGESLTVRIAGGILAVILGVFVASTAGGGNGLSNDDGAGAGAGATNSQRRVLEGYFLAVAHIVLDTAGASITKQHRGDLGPFAIGLLRFGSSAIMLAVIGSVGRLTSFWLPSAASSSKLDSPPDQTSGGSDQSSSSTSNTSSIGGDGSSGGSGKRQRPVGWWSLPSRDVVSQRDWRYIVLGTFFVTFVGPALFLRSLLLMPLGIAATLSCLGPLYEPAIARVVRGTTPDPRAVAGAICAFLGVGALCL